VRRFIHSIPDAVESFGGVLTDEDSQVQSYAWPTFIAMMGVIICFTIEEVVDTLSALWGVSNLHSHGAHGHGHGHGAAPHVGHDDHACGHTLEDHEQNDGECDAQPLEEMCDHHHGHSVSTDDEEDIKNLDGLAKKKVKQAPKESDDELDVDADLVKAAIDRSAHSKRVVKMFVLFFGLLFHVRFSIAYRHCWVGLGRWSHTHCSVFVRVRGYVDCRTSSWAWRWAHRITIMSCSSPSCSISSSRVSVWARAWRRPT
jgi:hypothetical protein